MVFYTYFDAGMGFAISEMINTSWSLLDMYKGKIETCEFCTFR